MTACCAYMTTAHAFASTLGIAGFATAEEPIQVAGTRVKAQFHQALNIEE